MNQTELSNLTKVIDRKTQSLPANTVVVDPRDNVDPNTQAEWASWLLRRMYVNHGIVKNPNHLATAVLSGANRYWFALRDGEPIAMAGLLDQSDGSVEVGRAVSFDNGPGSLLMLLAAFNHFSTSRAPLVAEVRISDNFEGVPSGEATQKICHGHLGLQVHAVLPAFNHGKPVRNEQFAFSSSQRVTQEVAIELPEDVAAVLTIGETAIALARKNFFPKSKLRYVRIGQSPTGWQTINDAPFHVVIPDSGCTSLETAVQAATEEKPFTLIPIAAVAGNAGAIIECLNQGFVPCGFDRILDASGHPTLWLGRLRPGTLLAPIKIIDDVLPPTQTAAIRTINRLFKLNIA